MSAVSANIDVSDSRLLKYSSSRFTLESFLIGRFSSTLLSEVLYRTRYFPLHSTLTLVPIDFEVNSCLTSVVCLSLHPKKKTNRKKRIERNYLQIFIRIRNLFFRVKKIAREHVAKTFSNF